MGGARSRCSSSCNNAGHLCLSNRRLARPLPPEAFMTTPVPDFDVSVQQGRICVAMSVQIRLCCTDTSTSGAKAAIDCTLRSHRVAQNGNNRNRSDSVWDEYFAERIRIKQIRQTK